MRKQSSKYGVNHCSYCREWEKVNEMARAVQRAGGRIHSDPEVHGWMYGQSFEDLDGHLWEIFWMNPSKMAEN